MAKDIFGYNRESFGSEKILPPGAIKVSVGGAINLVQSVSVTYQREVSPTYELGSEDVYLVAGKSNGTVEVSRLIGDALEPYLPGSACELQDITITKGTATCGDGEVNLVMRGMVQRLTFSAQAGDLTVTDGATFTISSLSKN